MSGSAAPGERVSEAVFKVEEMPEELEMITVNSAELEEQARKKRLKQEEQKAKRQKEVKRTEERKTIKQQGVNEFTGRIVGLNGN